MTEAKQLQKVREYLCRLARNVTKANEFQHIRRDRNGGGIEYQIFADTDQPENGCQIAWVQSTRHDAEFIAAVLAQAPLFDELLGARAEAAEQQLQALQPYAQHLPTCATRKPNVYEAGFEGFVDDEGDLQTRSTRKFLSGPGPCDCGLASLTQPGAASPGCVFVATISGLPCRLPSGHDGPHLLDVTQPGAAGQD